MSHLALSLAGETLWLLPDKALYWPARRLLLLADLHLGKAATFRARGQPVPDGTTATNLARLDAVLARYETTSLIFLGDLLHAREALTPALLERLAAWRARHPGLDCLLVRGNHDRHAGPLPDALGIDTVAEQPAGPFLLRHEPHREPGRIVLAGHVHPAYVLQGPGRDRVRLPCFSIEDDLGVLPAFGDFTGSWTVASAPGRRIYLVGDGQVWPVPPVRG
ncbi:ligase-associated DNA damage response endonuclease PdeM [Chitiniphilus purpureus]|uniref:Ligase-associated DNA damage response endonuclease PdeM n=1 Tax=Chitiniphilus purpureus TaxID=2981137 RepID=A0ABY6DS32_9NEIS|nr:ligase-associated DNA damage response endonuclease PdeM [Chitiniphilus sp. CD1]UXY17043.1 ligase-associated DNA damage response endonuclease PdeM [Chitiniphilus sp. CD1]